MPSCSDKRNPLQHGGTSQAGRILAPLQPDYIRADERGYADWISFAGRFAQYLNYYDTGNAVAGNWQPFFTNDISAIIGTIAIQDIEAYRQTVKVQFDTLKDDDYKNDLPLLKKSLGRLFGVALTFATALDAIRERLPADHAMRVSIDQAVKTKLAPVLSRLMSYHKGGSSNSDDDGTTSDDLIIITDADFTGWNVLDQPVQNASNLLITSDLSSIWTNGPANLSEWYAALSTDRSIYGRDGSTPFERIRHAANHNLFAGAFDLLLSTYTRLVSDAGRELMRSITGSNGHQPHYALFLSFLHLYRHAQDAMNTITDRHLNFYYKDVLRLQPKGSLPQSAHIVATLAKGVKNHILPAGTPFKAGKDSAGKDVIFTLDTETVFNEAAVAGMKSVYIGDSGDNIVTANATALNDGRVFAAPVSNSADGLGEPLLPPQKGWHPFAGKSFKDGLVTAVNVPAAQIGFALASPNLLLAEGERHIACNISFAQAISTSLTEIPAIAFLTTEKGWLEREVTLNLQHIYEPEFGGIGDYCRVSLMLTAADGAITPYVSAVHGGAYTTQWPVLKIILKHDTASGFAYPDVSHLTVKAVKLIVGAGMDTSGVIKQDGVKTLKLSNDFGSLDASKAFDPFGFNPKRGSALIIGSDEVAVKRDVQARLSLSWLDITANTNPVRYPAITSPITLGLDILAGGSWRNIIVAGSVVPRSGYDSSKETLLPANNTFLYPNNDFTDRSGVLTFDSKPAPYGIQSKAGFLRLRLQETFGYDAYVAARAAYLSAVALKITPAPANPGDVPPYMPRLESITLHYMATATVSFTELDTQKEQERVISLFSVYPFGEVESLPYRATGAVPLLPQFRHTSDASTVLHKGEWYIGLTGIGQRDSVNILIQVLEGTANPLTVKPADHVSWSYLTGAGWASFDRQSVTDGTAQLIQSGIIHFILPADAATQHTMMPTGYIWLRAAVSEAPDAVCKIEAVLAGAAVVTFSNNDNAADFGRSALPAGSITKLAQPVAAVKTILQPFSSFGGRPAEDAGHYYLRSSERLRHKDRAITIWDYEHLLLEAFPELHRVKCLNHTRYAGGTTYDEGMPGHVTIITIPRLETLNERNPLRPYTSERTLQQISDYLQSRISCHVTAHVRHPLFEEVALSFSVRLYPAYEWNVYSKRLQEEITAFLTPWAYGSTSEAAFGGTVRKSVLINFIEDRPYVDYISLVKMYHHVEGEPLNLTDTDEAKASTARSILVSVPPAGHALTEIPNVTGATAGVRCIDQYNAVDHIPNPPVPQ